MSRYVAILALSATLHAAPVGNTSSPKILQEGFLSSCRSWMNLRIGYEGDFVTDGRMKQYDQGQGRVDSYEQWTNSGLATLNIVNRLDMYGVFGASWADADWRFSDASAGTITRIKLKTEANFLWAVGARVILCEWCNTSLGTGGRYSSCNYQPNSLTSNGLSTDVTGSQCNWEEWQVNLDLSYKIDLFTPYIGGKYLSAKTHLQGFSTPISSSLTGENSFKNRESLGLYVGCALSTGKIFMLNVEARFIDEEAVTVSADLRF